MSLRVNLIREPEQRSGSRLNVKSVARIASIVIPVSLALLVSQRALSSFMLSSQLSILESQWSAVAPKQKMAIKQAARLNFNKQTHKELEGWAAARPDWNQVLAAIMQAVPDTIQLTALRVTLADKADSPPPPAVPQPPAGPQPPASPPPPVGTPPPAGAPIRDYQLSIEGVTRVQQSMQAVQTLEENLGKHPLLNPLFKTVEVANFAADSASKDELSRVFTIQCQFKTLPPKETP